MSTPADPPPPRGLRVGDAERNAAADALQQHLTSGRLTLDEYADRAAVVANAKTQGELDAMFTDLPPIAGAPGAAGAWANPLAGHPPAHQSSGTLPATNTPNRNVVRAVMGAMPFIALLLFLATRQWWVFLLIPLTYAVVGPLTGGTDDRRRDRRRDR